MSIGVIAAHDVIGGGGGSSYAAAVLADSPAAYYRMDDAAGFSATTASSNFTGETPANAFDCLATTYWTTNGTTTGWLRVQLTTAATYTAYSLRRRDDIPGRNPTAWTFEGSNDGSSWTTLDTRSGITWGTAGELKSFTFTNTTAYLYYRINVTANNGDVSYLSIADLILPIMADSAGAAADRYGLHNSGVSVGATSLLVGDADTAVTYNGSSGSSVVPYASWQAASTFTVDAVIKPSSVTGTRVIASRQDVAGNAAWTFRLEGTTLKFYYWNAGGSLQTAVSASTVFAINTIYHVALVFTASSNVYIYVNGTQVGTAATTTLASSTHSLRVGASANSGEYFSGVIDELAFYPSALTSTRIAAHNAAR